MGSGIIREAKVGDIPAIRALTVPLYGYDWGESFYIWQCFENVQPATLLVAEDDGQIVGMFGLQERRLTCGLVCGQISWINIATKHRGTGLFGRMGREALARFPGLDLLFIFSNSAGVQPCETTLQLRFIGELQAFTLGAIDPRNGLEFTVETVTPTTQFASLGKAAADVITFDRPEAYRRWRLAGSPVYRYEKVTIASGEYAVVKLYHHKPSGKRCGDIVDIECRLADDERLKLLLSAAHLHLTAMGAETVSLWASHWSLRRAVAYLGGSINGNRSHFGIRCIGNTNGEMSDLECWHLVQSDATNY